MGVKKKGQSELILGALGDGDKVFSETFNRESCNFNNQVCWYFNTLRSFGFSYYRNIYLDDIDTSPLIRKFNDYKLSISLNGTKVGRIGDIIVSKQNNNLQDYELINLYKKNY